MKKKIFKFSKFHLLAVALIVLTAGIFFAAFGYKRGGKNVSGYTNNNVYEVIPLTDNAFTLEANNGKYPDIYSQGSYLVFNGNVSIPASHSSSTYNAWELAIPGTYTYQGTPYKVKEIRTGEVNVGQNKSYNNLYPNQGPVTCNKTSKFASAGIHLLINKVSVNKEIEYIQKGSFHNLSYLKEIEVPFVGTSRLSGYKDITVLGNTTTTEDPDGAFLAIFGDETYVPVDGVDGNNEAYEAFNYYGNKATLNAPYYFTPTQGAGNGLIPWHESNTSIASKYFVAPPNLENIEITDASTIPGEAFFHNPIYKRIKITFGQPNDEIAQIGADGNVINGATEPIQFTKIVNYMNIGDYAFSNCAGLVEADVTSLATYGIGMFSQCKSLTDVALPDNLTAINKNTFFQCNELSEIKIPGNVSIIDDHAFDQCISLQTIYGTEKPKVEKSFYIPDNVKTIGVCAFRYTKPQAINVPTTVETIDYMAFNGCSNLKELVLPFVGKERGNGKDSPTEEALFGYIFGDYGAGQVEGLTDMINNPSLTVIQDADGDATTPAHQGSYYIPKNLRTVTITDETVIGKGSFWNCSMITSLTIQTQSVSGIRDTESIINEGALYGCSNIVSLSIPFVGGKDSVDFDNGGHLGFIFGKKDFTNSVQVQTTDWRIPSTLKTISLSHQTTLRTDAFRYVKNVEKYVIGAATQEINRSVFTGNTGMKELSLPFVGRQRGIVHDYPHSYYYDRWHKDTIRNSVLWLFSYNTGDEMYNDYYITGIGWYPGEYAGSVPESLETINITNETYVPYAAFWGFQSLKNVNIYDNDHILEHIDGTIMYGCSNLENINVSFIGQDSNPYSKNDENYVLGYFFGKSSYPNTYTASEAGQTFYIPKTLQRVYFGKDMTTLANYAFANCNSITSIQSDAAIKSLGAYAFANCTNLATLTLPNAIYTIVGTGAFMNDRALGEMTSFIKQLTDDSTNLVKKVNDYAFYGTAITDLHLKQFNYVGNYAFANCLEVKTADFTDTNFQYVGSHLFDGCTHLTDVTLTTYSSDYMFANCTGLENLYLDYLTQNNGGFIPDGFLYNCYNLKDTDGTQNVGLVMNPLTSGVVEIGEYAFAGCKKLTSLTLPETLTTIKQGAFQNCSGLDMLRIPRNTLNMVAGSRVLDNGDIEDLFKQGIFYGCNDAFYLQVFYPEDQWPANWGYNWNCYYPIYIIGDSTENWFTYEYMPEYKGYFITGLNLYDSQNNPDGYQISDFFNDFDSLNNLYISPILKGTITFPNTHDGLFVYGIKANSFINDTDGYILRDVENFILPPNCRNLEQNSLNIKDFYTDYGPKYINIFSNRTVAQAKNLTDLHYGEENHYVQRGTIIYKEAWTYIGTQPTIYMSHVSAQFESDTFTYKLGKEIKPTITALTKNSVSVRYAEDDDVVSSNLDDLVKNAFNNIVAGSYDSLNEQAVEISYTDNINVGTGYVLIKSNDSRFTGTLRVPFKIIPYQVDLFNESDVLDGGYSAKSSTYYEYISEIVTESAADTGVPPAITHMEYNNDYWRWSNWTQGGYAYGLPNGYTMTGVLRTTDKHAGYYGMYMDQDTKTNEVMYLNDYFGSTLPVGGFTWQQSPRVYDRNDKDVTGNFSFMITKCVCIDKFVVTADNISWDGTYNSTNKYYEYRYRGEKIVPVPTVKNEDGKVLDIKAVVSVSPFDAIYPGSQVYNGTITSYDTQNFEFYSTAPITVSFIIKNALLKVSMNAVYTIKETDNWFEFNDWSNIGSYPEYNIRIEGLNKSSILTGNVKTSGWEAGVYRNTNQNNFTFDWDIAGYKIISNTLFETDGVTPKDESAFYDLTLDINVTIKLIKFDYELCMDVITVGNYQDSVLSKTVGINSVQYSVDGTTCEIEYGADGYNHELSAWVKNTTGAAIEFKKDGNVGTNFVFKDINTYVVDLSITKQKFYDVDLKITLRVVKGDYQFKDLTKEYDRDPVDPLSQLYRTPIDFDNTKMTFDYYNATTNTKIANAPAAIGNYRVIINTQFGHSEWFNDVTDLEIPFQITKRSLIIKAVDTVAPFDSKVYDGEPWKRQFTLATDQELNLLPGDMLTGLFLSKRANIGLYSSEVYGDFIASSWKIDNGTLGEQTGYYKVKFVGDYEILPRTIIYTHSGVDKVYDGIYSWIDVKVLEPTTGYTIYYSEIAITTEDMDTDESMWVMNYPYTYNQPGTYTVYFKIVADTYKTVYDYDVVKIDGKDVQFGLGNQYVYYDGFDHTIEVTGLDPWNATVLYAVIDENFDNNYESLSWTTTPPMYTDIGVYNFAVQVSAPNYNTKYGTASLTIQDGGPQIPLTVVGDNVDYDGNAYGFVISNLGTGLTLNDLIITYAEETNPTDESTWITPVITDLGNGSYHITPYVDAGDYPITVLIKCKGYAPTNVSADCKIKPIPLGDVQISGYSGYFDGKKHTVLLTNTQNTLTSSGIDTNDQSLIDGQTLNYYLDALVGGVSNVLNLTVYYSPYNLQGVPDAQGWSTEPLAFKDVGNYMVYVMITGPNVETKYLFAQIIITRSPTPPTVTIEDQVFEYFARPILNTEIEYKTIHDGLTTFDYQAYDNNNMLVSTYIPNPQAIGKYKVTIKFAESNNCLPTTATCDFEIVPRRLKLEFEDKLEYDGTDQAPQVTVVSNTTDQFTCTLSYIGQHIVIGTYTANVQIDQPMNGNYYLDPSDDVITYYIVKRKLYVTLDTTFDYDSVNYYSKYFDSTNLDPQDGMTISNLLDDDKFGIQITTNRKAKADYLLTGKLVNNGGGYLVDLSGLANGYYGYKLLSISAPSGLPGMQDGFLLQHFDNINGYQDCDYYDIILDLKVRFLYPQLEIDIADPQIHTYDGTEKTIVFDITSLTGQGYTPSVTGQYWLLNKPEEKFNSLGFIDVGEYEIGYEISADNFEPATGSVKLVIKQAVVNVVVDQLTKVYDKQYLEATYSVTLDNPTDINSNAITIREAEKPEIWYINIEEIEKEGFTTQDVAAFFLNSCSPTHAFYDTFMNNTKAVFNRINQVGDYFTVVYFPGTNNIALTIGYESLSITKRPLYFNYLGTSPLIISKPYDGYKQIVQMNQLEYDKTSGNNSQPDAGLLPGFNFGTITFKDCAFRTYSANARGEAGNGDPYQFDGDFEFFKDPYVSIKITSDGLDNECLNYYPVINPVNVGGVDEYQVQVIITRIDLPKFDVPEYLTVQYSGQDALPDPSQIDTPSDGQWKYYYRKCDDSNFSNPATTPTYNESGVGYYELYLTILTGTNFYYWNRSGDKPYDETDGQYFYKRIYLTVIPRQVEIIWNEKEFVYDGTNHTPSGYILDVNGLKRNVDVEIHDSQDVVINGTTVKDAGTYVLYGSLSFATTLLQGIENYEVINPVTQLNVLKRTFEVSYTGVEKYLYTFWSKHYDENDFADYTDPTWIPGHTLDLTARTKVSEAAHFRYASQFEKTFTVKDELGQDVSSNYEFNLNLDVTLQETALKVKSTYLETQFTNQFITPDIKFNYPLAEVNMQFATVTLDWDTGEEPATFVKNYVAANELPTFKDVGWYRIYYKFSLAGADDSQNTYEGSVELKITQAPAYLTIPDLDQVYNAAAVNLPISSLVGGYNGTSANLVIKYYNRGDLLNPLSSAPSDAGLYTVVITDSADNQNTLDGKTNYSTLEVSKDFEIFRRDIKLVVNDTWVINDESDLQTPWSHSGDLLNNNSATDYYCENIVTSTGLRYSINSNVNLQRKTYNYSSSQPNEGNFTLNEFNITWEAWYLNSISTALDTSVSSNQMTPNYRLSAVINLTVRFKYIEYTITDKTYDYDGVAKSVLPNINVTAPANGYTIALGTVIGTYNLPDYTETLPGAYTVYVKITCPNYEDALDKTSLTIRYYDRNDVGLDVTDISKTYNALVYDGTVASGGVPTVTWKNPSQVYGSEAIPSPSSWTVNYYLATGSTKDGWEKASEAVSQVVDADEYMVEIIIPAGVYYGETTILKHFKISRAQVKISGQASDYTYNGSTWKYNIALNPDNLVIDGLVDDQANNIKHEFVSGTLYTTSVNAGDYGPSSTTGKNIDIYAGYEIADNNGLEVTVNYEYLILVTLTIKKANMVYAWNIPDVQGNGTYDIGYVYDTTTHYPSLTIISPSLQELTAAGFQINYSRDDVTYSPEEVGYITVNDYLIFAQLHNIPNYNDLNIFEEFSIVMAQNTLQIEDLSKIYDGNSVGLPKITTLEGAEIAKASWVTWLDADNGDAVLSSRPKEVGNYKVRVTYPTTENYEGIEAEKEFSITKNNFTITFETNKLIYDTTAQEPETIFTSEEYPAINIKAMLDEGTDYEVTYYNENDTSLANPIAKPINVGTYIVAYKLISAKALKNFTLNNSNMYYNWYYIIPRDIVINYSGKKPYAGNAPVTIPISDITVTNLPTDVVLNTSISTIPAKWKATDSHKADTLYTNTSFTDYYVWDSVDGNPHLLMTQLGADDDLGNYNIKMNVNLTVATDDIYYTVAPYDDVYDGQAHTFDFSLDMGSGVSYSLYYSIDQGATWSESLPYYTNATISKKNIFVKVHFNDGTYQDTVLGDDEPDSSSFYVRIAKADSILSIADEEKLMDKIYDGKLIENPEVTYNTFVELDKRDEKLQFKYYQKQVTSQGGTTYNEISVIDVMNVGEYKVEIKLLESDNFLESTVEVIPFEIKKRDIVVRFKDIQEKTYDADRWQALISNTGALDASGATIEGISGVTESGLVQGDMFTGTIQTITANAGDYKVYPDDFAWLEAPKIISSSNNDVTNNYNIDVALWAKINKASFEDLFEALDYIGYVDGLYHGIIFNWIKTPLMSGLADPMTLVTYTTNPNDANTYSSTPITECNAGTTTVYFKIQGPNYETYDSSRKIVLNAKPTGAPTVDPKGKPDGSNGDRVYDGNAYNYDPQNPDIVITNSDQADTRIPTITYYKDDGTALTSAPIDAGKYYFTLSYDANIDYAAAVFGQNKEYGFVIKPYELTVEWTGDKDPTSNDPMIMYYTGSQLTPKASATDTRTNVPAAGTVLASNDSLPTLTLTVTNPTSGLAVSVGSYTVVASITVDSNLYSQNYRLTNDSITYKIKQSGAGPIPTTGPGGEPVNPGDPGSWPPGPWPDPDDICESIEIDDMNYKDLLNTPFTFGDQELYVHVTFNYKNFGPLKLWYVFDQQNGTITKIYKEDFTALQTPINQLFTITGPKDDNGDPDWSLKLFDSSTTADPSDTDYYYVPVKVVLTDKVNTTWDTTTGDVSDLNKNIVFDRLKLDPTNGDVWVVEPGYETTYMWSATDTGVVSYQGYDQEASTYTYRMDGNELKFSIRVIMDGNLVNSNVNIELVEGVDYEIIWFNNTGPTEDGCFTVKSLDTASYEFIIGDENQSSTANKAGKFVINSPEPKYLKLLDVSTIKYVHANQDFQANTYTETVLVADDYGNVVSGADASMDHDDIFIGHTYQYMSVYYILNQFANSKKRIKIKDIKTGDYVYDPTDSAKDLTTLTTDDLITGSETDYIKTGMTIELYDTDTPGATDTPIDSLQIVLKGDTNGDGKIMANDATSILFNAVNDLTEDEMKEAKYRAGLVSVTTPKQMAKEASSINTHAVGNTDINSAYSI